MEVFHWVVVPCKMSPRGLVLPTARGSVKLVSHSVEVFHWVVVPCKMSLRGLVLPTARGSIKLVSHSVEVSLLLLLI